jgi:hypothetical protein
MSEQPQYIHQDWPAWRYGPKGESDIFNCEEEVPKGWNDDVSRLAKATLVVEEDF